VCTIATSASYHHRVARRKPFLLPAAIWKCLIWAKENITRDWNEVRLGHRRVMRLPGEEFLSMNIQPTFKSGCKSIMVWGCIAYSVKGPLIKLEFLPTTMSKKGQR
ncbi:hypothetical protein HETIRDRAFT_54154, partial [Heterobasidion irregulare TC 32-1]